MDTHDLDEFILNAAGENWRKVAMVIAMALTDPGLEFPETDDDETLIANRIEALILQEALEVRGDPSKWRFSEIRRITVAGSAA